MYRVGNQIFPAEFPKPVVFSDDSETERTEEGEEEERPEELGMGDGESNSGGGDGCRVSEASSSPNILTTSHKENAGRKEGGLRFSMFQPDTHNDDTSDPYQHTTFQHAHINKDTAVTGKRNVGRDDRSTHGRARENDGCRPRGGESYHPIVTVPNPTPVPKNIEASVQDLPSSVDNEKITLTPPHLSTTKHNQNIDFVNSISHLDTSEVQSTASSSKKNMLNSPLSNNHAPDAVTTLSSQDFPPGRPLSPIIIMNPPNIDGNNMDSLGLKSGFPSSCDDLTSSATSSRKGMYLGGTNTYPPRLKLPRSQSKAHNRKLSPTPQALSPYSPTSALSLRSLSTRSIVSDTSTLFGPEKEQVVMERMRLIVDGFRNRAKKVKHRLEQPPTPTEDISDDEISLQHKQPKIILDDFNDSLYASKSSLAAGIYGLLCLSFSGPKLLYNSPKSVSQWVTN